jgi:hypothetical protein
MGDMETATSGFLAKYDGKCLECGLAIHPGKDTIVSIPVRVVSQTDAIRRSPSRAATAGLRLQAVLVAER